MLRATTRIALRHLAVVGAMVTFSTPASTQTVWSGLSLNFSKAAAANPSLPANQDCLTANVCLTRGTTRGLYNIAKETGYASTSPADTEWATNLVPGNASKTIAATNFADLAFTNWVDAYGGMNSRQLPAMLTSRNAVVHLITDNIYLDLRFSSWGGSGGRFAYQRAVAPPMPTATGDYNRNGEVDAADYVAWRDTLTQLVAAGEGADGNASGMVDSGDYEFWQARFGNAVPSATSASAIPEPAGIVLLLTVVGFVTACRQKPRRI